jgi:hypothetical protein
LRAIKPHRVHGLDEEFYVAATFGSKGLTHPTVLKYAGRQVLAGISQDHNPERLFDVLYDLSAHRGN